MSDVRILVVDDEPAIRRFLRTSISAHGYQLFECSGGVEAMERVAEVRPDLIILDLGLPDLDGVEVTRGLREWTRVPIVILSVRGGEKDKIEALDAGADDYLTKPFSVGELLARLRAALRRAAQTSVEPIFRAGDLEVDFTARRVTVAGREVKLTPTEYELLRILAVDAGRVLTHKQLLRRVWGDTYEKEVHILRVNISNLRRKLEPDSSRPTLVLTEPGVGYRIRSPETF